jgi:hypothetical protein
MGRFRSCRNVTSAISFSNTRCPDVSPAKEFVRASEVCHLARVAGGALPLARTAEAAIGDGALAIQRTVRCVQSSP